MEKKIELTLNKTNSSSEIKQLIKPQRKASPLRFQTYEDQQCIQKLTYLIVRPPRLKYDPLFYLKNPRPDTHQMHTFSISFDLTIYTPIKECRYCILYLHGNSSCRLEGMNMVKEIPDDVALACFDFDGCGNGKQQFITLGIKESRQANVAAKYLCQKGFKVVGWGRSMGAASVLLSDIKIMVADSAFSSIKQICSSIAQKQVKWMPHCLFSCIFSCVFCCVRDDFKKKTSEEINSLSIIDHIRSDPQGMSKSALFISGDEDLAIDCSHSRKLYEAFQGNKQIQIFPGSHNSTRPPNVLKNCFSFIDKILQNQRMSSQHSIAQIKIPSVMAQIMRTDPAIVFSEP